MLKWIVYLQAVAGLILYSLVTLYLMATTLLAPLAVRLDSSYFRDIAFWTSGSMLFVSIYLLQWIRTVFGGKLPPKFSFVLGAIGAIMSLVGIAIHELDSDLFIIAAVTSVLTWFIFALFLWRQSHTTT